MVGVDEAESEGGPDYGYPGDKFCYYVADERAWNVYLFPSDGDHAHYQRRGAAAHYPDVTSFELAGASDAIQFNAGSSMLFATGDFVVKVECLTDDAPVYREDLAAALVAAVGALEAVDA